MGNKSLINSYWIGKEERAKIAYAHTKQMREGFKEEIEFSIKNTKIYDTDFNENDVQEKKEPTRIIVEDIDSVGAILKYSDEENSAVLNFSSYKNPGGMFLNGSRAQEECLCHESFLYNVLSEFESQFYDWNNKHKNKALYLNRGLYSPNILFSRAFNNAKKCDVITCAAPNKAAAKKYLNVSDMENSDTLRSRIKYVLDIAKSNNVKNLILGAYGCGVFGQDAKEVAEIFKEYLNSDLYGFETVVFAIPNGRDGNLQKFEEVFK